MRTAIERFLDQEEIYETDKAEDMAEYEDYLRDGNAIDNETVIVWLNQLANGKKATWPN